MSKFETAANGRSNRKNHVRCPMRCSYIPVIGIALLFCLPALTQVNAAKRMIAALPKEGPVQRDAAAEKGFLNRQSMLSTQLTATAKAKLENPVQALRDQLGNNPVQGDAGKYARQEVSHLFSTATAEQTDLLSFYVLAEVLRRCPQQTEAVDQGAGMNELAELTDRRLQQTMDRRSKFMAALSALAQQISKTPDAIVQSLK